MDPIPVFVDFGCQEGEIFVYDRINPAGHEVGCLRSSKTQKIGHNAVEPVGLLNDDVRKLILRLGASKLLL